MDVKRIGVFDFVFLCQVIGVATNMDAMRNKIVPEILRCDERIVG
jgi:hypothetical protein